MRRRSFIAASSALAASATGCIGALDDGSDPNTTDDGNATDDADTDGGNADTTTDAAYALSVSVEHPRYVVTTRSTYSNQLNDAKPLDEFDDGVRESVREAVDEGRVSVDEPGDALLDAVRGVGYVREGDEVYGLDYSLPEYVVTGTVADVSEDEVDDDRVVHAYDDVLRALGPDNRQIVMMGASVIGGGRGELETGEYRTTSLTDELDDFLNETDYIGVSTSRDPTATDEYVELELSRHDPDDYYIAAERLSREELFGVDEVRELGSLPDDVADVVRAAVDDGYRDNSIPDGFEDATGDAYFYVNERVHRPELREPDYDAAPVEITAEITDAGFDEVNELPDKETLDGYRDEYEDAVRNDDEAAEEIIDRIRDEYSPDDAATFELSLTNTSDASVEVFSGAPAPYGVLYAENPDADDDEPPRRLVWSEAYAESGHVHFGPRGLGVNAIGLTTEIPTADSETETYDVAFPPGEYRVEETVDVSRSEGDGYGDGETYPYTVVIEVDETEA